MTFMNNDRLLVIAPRESEQAENPRLARVLAASLDGLATERLTTAAEAEAWLSAHPVAAGERFARVLFAVDLDSDGVNLEYSRLLRVLRAQPYLLEGWLGGVIVDAESELYTKSTAQELVLAANMSGCAFVGRSLVEGTGSLRNFTVTAHKLGTDDLMLAYIDSACALVRAIMALSLIHISEPTRRS